MAAPTCQRGLTTKSAAQIAVGLFAMHAHTSLPRDVDAQTAVGMHTHTSLPREVDARVDTPPPAHVYAPYVPTWSDNLKLLDLGLTPIRLVWC